MPTRLIREGILSSEAVCSLSWAAEVFYRRLMSVVDDYGRFSASTKLIRAACYPLQIDKVSDSDIEKWLSVCETAALVRVYPAMDGKRYLEITKFGQQVRTKSKYPEPMEEQLQQLITPDNNCYQLKADVHLDGVEDGVVNTSLRDVVVSKLDDCPHNEILALYAELLPMLAQPRVWEGKRQANLRQRWKWVLTNKNSKGEPYATDRDSGLAFFRRFFTYVAERCQFLLGQNKEGWTADLAWMVEASNFAKIIEGKYERREVAA